jgi:hypothetical protein
LRGFGLFVDAFRSCFRSIDVRFATGDRALRWLDQEGQADVTVFGSPGERLEGGTEVPDLLDLYSSSYTIEIAL